MYADGDHISEEDAVQQRYMQNFWERVGPVIAPLKPAEFVIIKLQQMAGQIAT